MCIVFYTTSQPGYKLVLASNRDEYLDRLTIPAGWHDFEPLPSNLSGQQATKGPEGEGEGSVLSGRDAGKAVGGTWLGITRDLRVGVLTNIRDPPPGPGPDSQSPLARSLTPPPSRGDLLKRYLSRRVPIQAYLETCLSSASEYEGFNLLLWDLAIPPSQLSESTPATDPDQTIGYLTNRPKPTITDLGAASDTRFAPSSSSSSSSPPPPTPHVSNSSGEPPVQTTLVQGLSNTPIDKPWPKVLAGQERMSGALRAWEQNRQAEGEDGLIDRMMVLLSQSNPITSLLHASTSTMIPPIEVPNPPASTSTSASASTSQGETKTGSTDLPAREKAEGDTTGFRWYGTRLSTVILVRDDGHVTFVERDIASLDRSTGSDQGDHGFRGGTVETQVKIGGGERRFEFQGIE